MITQPRSILSLPEILFISLWIGSLLPSHSLADTELNIPGYRLQWHDEFEGTSVDANRWEVNVGVNAGYIRQSDGRYIEPHWFGGEYAPWSQVIPINDERQYYSPDNVTVANGILQIRAREETVVNPVGWYDPAYHLYTSGKLNTADEFQFQFGIVRWRAQLPAGKGLWPALWMLSAPEPWFWDDEIDVMEGRGSQPSITTSAHHYKIPDGNGGRINQYNSGLLNTGINIQTTYNVYGLEWQPGFIRTDFNGREVFYDEQAIPQVPLFLIMNAAVGGHFDGLPDETTAFPTDFNIDWVRVWQAAAVQSDLSNGDFESFQGARWADWNTLDDGNLATESVYAFQGNSSVRIDRRNNPQEPPVIPDPSNLFADGTASAWAGWLNELSAENTVTGTGAIDPASIPAVTGTDSIQIGVHQSADSPIANAVAYRQLDGGFAHGKSFTFTGTISIDSSFSSSTTATAFIRVFDNSYTPTDVAVSVLQSGNFEISAVIPDSGVPIVQVGIETTGPTGSGGSLTATRLSLEETVPQPEELNQSTGFYQTVVVGAGENVRFGLLSANHPENPLGVGAQGRLRLAFLDAGGTVIDDSITLLVDESTSATPVPTIEQAVTPAGTASVRMSIERITTDPSLDQAGAFLADAAFLHIVNSTELPEFTSEPDPTLAVQSGNNVDLAVTVASPTPVTYQWFRNGTLLNDSEDLTLTASPSLAGTYFLLATNEAGSTIGAVTTLAVQAVDSDGDLLDDFDELNLHGTNPNNPDSDHDGLSDYDELMLTHTDPLDPRQRLYISDVAIQETTYEITFPSVPGVTYDFEASATLSNWQQVGSPHTAIGEITIIPLTLPVSDPPLRFVRLMVGPN